MRPEAERAVEQWCQAHERLYQVTMQQLEALKQEVPTDPEQWQELQGWMDEREKIRAEIELVQQQLIDELGVEEVKKLFEQKVATILSSTRVVTFEAVRAIELAMITTGAEIQNTQNQRKLANAYSQLEQDTHESYFFDEKK